MDDTTRMQTEPHERSRMDRLRNLAAGGRAEKGYYRLQEQVSRHPGSSLAVGFGIGFGIGILLGVACSDAMHSRRQQRWSVGSTAERVGRQVLDSVAGILPDSVSRRMT